MVAKYVWLFLLQLNVISPCQLSHETKKHLLIAKEIGHLSAADFRAEVFLEAGTPAFNFNGFAGLALIKTGAEVVSRFFFLLLPYEPFAILPFRDLMSPLPMIFSIKG
jgi:hypothetical protein